jgi:hypothetical protein
MLSGGPKLWIIINPNDNNRLLKKIVDGLEGDFTGDVKCVLRNKEYHVHPAQLKLWGIKFKTV